MNYDFVNKLSDIEESVSPAGFFFSFSRKIMTMSPSAKLKLVKNAHLKSQNALKLTRNYM